MTNRQHIIAHTISIIIIMSDDEIALFDRTNDSKWFKWNWMTQGKIRSMRIFSQPIFIMKQFCGARTLFINRSNAMGNFYISSHFLCELNSRRCFFVYFVKTKTEYVRCCCQRHSQTLIVLTVRSKWMVRVPWIAKNSSYIITRNFVFSFGLLVGWLLLRFFFLLSADCGGVVCTNEPLFLFFVPFWLHLWPSRSYWWQQNGHRFLTSSICSLLAGCCWCCCLLLLLLSHSFHSLLTILLCFSSKHTYHIAVIVVYISS